MDGSEVWDKVDWEVGDFIRKLIQEYLRVVNESIKAASRERDMGLRYIHKVES